MWCNVGFAECVEGNCISGQGTLIDNGHTYVGEFKDGKVHGQGNLIYPNGDKYVGEYQNGKRHGQGTFTKKNGDTYVGEFKNSMKHGQGTYTFANGDEYFGAYKKDKKSIILAKNVEKQSKIYRNQLKECQKSLDRKKYIIF